MLSLDALSRAPILLATGLRKDPLGKLERSSRLLSCNQGGVLLLRGKGERRVKGRGEKAGGKVRAMGADCLLFIYLLATGLLILFAAKSKTTK